MKRGLFLVVFVLLLVCFVYAPPPADTPYVPDLGGSGESTGLNNVDNSTNYTASDTVVNGTDILINDGVDNLQVTDHDNGSTSGGEISQEINDIRKTISNQASEISSLKVQINTLIQKIDSLENKGGENPAPIVSNGVIFTGMISLGLLVIVAILFYLMGARKNTGKKIEASSDVEKIIHYIKFNRSKGYKLDDIRNNLLRHGYDRNNVGEAFRKL